MMDRKLPRGGLVLGAGASTTQWPTIASVLLSATLIGQLGISVWSGSASAAGQITVNQSPLA